MTDEQIIKALEVHSNEKFDNCEGCPYLVGDFCEGFTKHSKPFRDVIDLINRQKAEIERLQKFKTYFDGLYGINLEVEGWHENGNTISFDEFYDSAIEDMDSVKELTEPTKIEHNSLCETETYESR